MQHLVGGGIEIIARNWRRPGGEIDIVARDGSVCVFVEVRSRSGVERGHPLESVTPRKRARIARAARLFIAEEHPSVSAFRFDVAGVTFRAGCEPELAYVADAFRIDP